MEPNVIPQPPGDYVVPLVQTPALAAASADVIEAALRRGMADHRREELRLDTQFDDHLGYILQPALAAYELERSTGHVPDGDEFQSAIKNNVPDGHTFKGFPIQFSHANTSRMLATLLKNPMAASILATRGDQVHFALAVRTYSFPERVNSVWVMLAVKFNRVDGMDE